MNTTGSILRIATLLILGFAGFILILCEEQDRNLWIFFWHVVLDKAIGVGCVFSMVKLYERWSRTDKWVARIEAWNSKGEE